MRGRGGRGRRGGGIPNINSSFVKDPSHSQLVNNSDIPQSLLNNQQQTFFNQQNHGGHNHMNPRFRGPPPHMMGGPPAGHPSGPRFHQGPGPQFFSNQQMPPQGLLNRPPMHPNGNGPPQSNAPGCFQPFAAPFSQPRATAQHFLQSQENVLAVAAVNMEGTMPETSQPPATVSANASSLPSAGAVPPTNTVIQPMTPADVSNQPSTQSIFFLTNYLQVSNWNL